MIETSFTDQVTHKLNYLKQFPKQTNNFPFLQGANLSITKCICTFQTKLIMPQSYKIDKLLLYNDIMLI